MNFLKKTILTLGAAFLFAPATWLGAQNQMAVSGQVTDGDDGSPLVGVFVSLKGNASVATVTSENGSYSLRVPSDGTLVFSLLGYNEAEVPVNGRARVDVALTLSASILDEVVVSALGIQRQAKSLTYSTQAVSSEDITRARDVNMMNALAGKAAGVTVTSNSSGLGGATKVSIRGFRSANGNNQPLYVVDGVPIRNSQGSQLNSMLSGGHDGGDGMSNLNPDDIASINVLKGASASALYGTEAANGVIMITTKKGQAGGTRVDFTSTTTFDQVAYLPELQNRYGESEGYYSWGAKTNPSWDKIAFVKSFFQTGFNTMNTISVSTGNDKNQTYVSYGNTTSQGIYPNSAFGRHNVTFRNTARMWDAVTLDASVQYIYQDVQNRPRPGGAYTSPLPGLYNIPVGHDVSAFAKDFETFDADRNLMAQSWYKSIAPAEQNPWWVANRTNRQNVRNRIIASMSAKWDVTDWFSLQARTSLDANADREEVKMYATTDVSLAGNKNGLYEYGQSTDAKLYSDLLATFNKQFGDFSVTATLGGSISDSRSHSLYSSSYNCGLAYANIFTIPNTITQQFSQSAYRTQNTALFATANFGFRDFLFVDVTARNDWSSALAYTTSFKKGFFYPSVGATLLLSEMLTLPAWINYGKIRASFAQVGNDLPTRITNPTGSVNYNGTVTPVGTAAFGELKPEISSSLEFGTEWQFFKNRLSVDFTWYKTNTTNQLFTLKAPEGSGYNYYYVNAGNIQNTGIEASVSVTPVMTNDFIWKSQFNMSRNKNTIIKLHDDITQFVLTDSGSDAYRMWLSEGGSYGDFYGYVFNRDASGKIVLDESGLPTKADGFSYIGNATPDFLLGWNNTLEYKNFSLGFLVDCRFGGDALSLTQAMNDIQGVSEATAAARDLGYVELEGQKINDVNGFYRRVGGRDGISGYYVYDATNIRLRELSFGYALPKKALAGSKVLKSASLSFVARNLVIFYCKAPYDTDHSMSAASGAQGVDFYGVPGTRSYGFNLKLGF